MADAGGIRGISCSSLILLFDQTVPEDDPKDALDDVSAHAAHQWRCAWLFYQLQNFIYHLADILTRCNATGLVVRFNFA
jgi:hypothetical protein